MSLKHLAYSAAVGAVLIATGPASADTVSKQTIDALQQQIIQLQQQLQSLQVQVQQSDADAKKAQTGVAQAFDALRPLAAAQPAAPKSPIAADGSLTLYGVTVYGTVDVGAAYQTHGTPLNSDAIFGLEYLTSKNSNKSVLAVAPNGLSQSKIGIKGVEALTDDLSGIFRFETGFSPVSGTLANGVKSVIDNNGIAQANQSSNADSSRAGQAFNGEAYVGIASKTYGQVSIGRHNGLMLDAVNAYDPNGGSYAFSPIGYSGMTAGAGQTEDARFDSSVRYAYKYDIARFMGMYEFGGSNGLGRSAYEFDIGADYAGFSVDALYNHVSNALAISALSATSVTVNNPANIGLPTLGATDSDDTSFSVLAKYTNGPLKLYGATERIQWDNPNKALAAGTQVEGGYILSSVNNTAYTNNKVIWVTWGGVKYTLWGNLDLTGAYYHYHQNSYKGNGCTDASAGSCSGSLDAFSGVIDYHFSKRLDLYGGAMFSRLDSGLSNGYFFHDSWDPMVGARFQF